MAHTVERYSTQLGPDTGVVDRSRWRNGLARTRLVHPHTTIRSGRFHFHGARVSCECEQQREEKKKKEKKNSLEERERERERNILFLACAARRFIHFSEERGGGVAPAQQSKLGEKSYSISIISYFDYDS